MSEIFTWFKKPQKSPETHTDAPVKPQKSPETSKKRVSPEVERKLKVWEAISKENQIPQVGPVLTELQEAIATHAEYPKLQKSWSALTRGTPYAETSCAYALFLSRGQVHGGMWIQKERETMALLRWDWFNKLKSGSKEAKEVKIIGDQIDKLFTLHAETTQSINGLRQEIPDPNPGATFDALDKLGLPIILPDGVSKDASQASVRPSEPETVDTLPRLSSEQITIAKKHFTTLEPSNQIATRAFVVDLAAKKGYKNVNTRDESADDFFRVIAQYQSEHGLKPDGMMGPKTQLHIGAERLKEGGEYRLKMNTIMWMVLATLQLDKKKYVCKYLVPLRDSPDILKCQVMRTPESSGTERPILRTIGIGGFDGEIRWIDENRDTTTDKTTETIAPVLGNLTKTDATDLTNTAQYILKFIRLNNSSITVKK